VPQQNAPADLDGQLVSIEGSLIETFTAADQVRMTLQAGNVVFEALLERSGANPLPGFAPAGSVLATTGVYELKYDEYGQPEGFQMRLRDSADISVIARPSWLTRGRILALSCTLVVGILLFFAWVLALRRRVRAQTEQIREQLMRESRLEAELVRTSKLESLACWPAASRMISTTC